MIENGYGKNPRNRNHFSQDRLLVSYEEAVETGWQVSYNMIKKPKVTSIFFLQKNLKEIALINVFLLLLFLVQYMLITVHRHASFMHPFTEYEKYNCASKFDSNTDPDYK